MGVDTVGFTLTSDKSVFPVLQAVDAALRSIDVDRITYDARPESELVQCLFKDGEDSRILWLFFRIDHDYEDVASGPRIIYNLGAWGRSELIIRTVAEAMAQYGPTYWCPADSGDDWQQVVAGEPAGGE